MTLLLGDVALLYGGLFLALIIRYGSLPTEMLWEAHRMPFLFVNLAWLVIFYIAGLYDVEKFSVSVKIVNILKTMLMGTVVAVAVFYFVPFSYFGITPKTNLFIDAVVVSLLLWLWRKLFYKVVIKSPKIKIFFTGNGGEISSFSNLIAQNPQFGYKIIQDISLTDIIVVSAEAKQDPELVKNLYEKVLSGKTIISFDKLYESITGMIPVSVVSKAWFWENLLEINKQRFEKTKRWMDAFLASALFVPLTAMLPIVALAIKLNSAGPIFYRQRRIGKNGKEFEIAKFRSMVCDAEKNGAVWASCNDNRATFVGKILRKTRIDELPQIWNVLKGELSFIGPRPERPEFVKELVEKIPYYQMRHLVKPGLSGWAQINFPYGASVEDALQKLQYDLFYVKNRSLVLEISIMLKTIMTLLKREGR